MPSSSSDSSADGAAKPRAAASSAGLRRPRPATGRHRPTGRLGGLRQRARRRWRRALDLCPLWIGLFLVAAVWALLPRTQIRTPRLEVGAIAPRTVVAPRDLAVADETRTEALEAEARARVPPVYDFDRGRAERQRERIARLFAAGRALLASPAATSLDAETLAERLADASGLRIAPPQAALLSQLRFTAELEDRLSGDLARVLRNGVVSDKDLLLENRVLGITVQELPSSARKTQLDLYDYLDYPDEVRDTIAADLRQWRDLSSSQRALLVDFLLANLSPNLTPNNSETLALRDRAAAEVGTVTRTFPAGQVLVRKGDRVDAITARALAGMAAGAGDLAALARTAFGIVLLACGVVLMLWLGLRREQVPDRGRERLLSECLLLMAAHLLLVRIAFVVAEAVGHTVAREPFNNAESYLYAIPFAALALIAVLLYGRNVALVVSLGASLLVARIGGEAAWQLVVYSLAGSLAAVYALDVLSFKQRSVTSMAGAIVGMVNVVTVLGLAALEGSGIGAGRLAFDAVCAFASGLLAAAITSFTVPILEGLLGVTTHIKLIELSNTNLPLLRRLALEAPGSFQHSLAVANLAKTGCEAVGADSVLANTCALYHDVGKIVRPQYFIENQAPGRNPHDKIQPSMSALILINHIKEGLDLAEAYHLPAPLRDAIEQHHGTRLIKFFYNRAKERADPDTEAVREDDFRYPGPKPQSKEMGILMLADAVEAASRTLVEPSQQAIRTMLRQIFDDCLSDHQLDDADLTLGDLRRVEEAFSRVLNNIHHRRIDYPGFDFNRPRRGGRGAGDSGTVAIATRKAS